MLLEFSAKNFKSIKDEIVLSSVSKNTNYLKNNLLSELETGKKEFIAKSLVLYGPNGSGKSNVLDAISMLKSLVLSSKDFENTSSLPINTFKFDEKTENGNTLFEIKFIQNEYLFIYGIEYNSFAIVNEYLRKSPKAQYYAKTSKIFERTNNKEMNNNLSISKMKKKFIDEIGDNRSYLSVAGFRNDPDVIDAYFWFSTKLFTMGLQRIKSSVNYSTKKLKSLKNDSQAFNKFFKNIINITSNADLGITKYNYKFRDFSFPKGTDETIKKYFLEEKGLEISSVHEINGKKYELPLEQSSVGTKKMFDIAGIMSDVEDQSGIFIIDELDCSLHPELLKNFIVLFHSNFKNSQLIFTCHDSILLDTDIMLKDQIWFTDKNKKTQATELYCLSDFKGLRKTSDIKNDYFKGIFGAFPNIKFERLINNGQP